VKRACGYEVAMKSGRDFPRKRLTMISEYAIFLAIIVIAIGVGVLAVTSVVALLIYLSRANRGEQ
jgi:hypothetical protein